MMLPPQNSAADIQGGCRRLRRSAGQRQGIEAALILSCDLAAVALAFCLAGALAMIFSELVLDQRYQALIDHGLTRVIVVGAFTLLAVGWMFAHEHYTQRIPFWQESREVVTICGLTLLSDGFAQYALKEPFSRSWLILTWVLVAILILLCRHVGRHLLDRMGLWTVKVIVVGASDTVGRTSALIDDMAGFGFQIVATLSPEDALSDSCDWPELLQRHGAEQVILALPEGDSRRFMAAIKALSLQHHPFLVLQDLKGLPVATISAKHLIGREALLLVGNQGLTRQATRGLKVMTDYVLAALLVLALAPLMVLIAVLVAADGGPVLFVHPRLGRSGRPFPCLKFRSMRMNAEEMLATVLAESAEARQEWDRLHKLRNDPRVTRIGTWLRRTSLDELPQLFNVLRGEMSLVGPRPIHVSELTVYGDDIAFYSLCRPGITGLWQVSGRNDIDISARVELDRWYVTNWSLWLDVIVILKTLPVVFARKGAY